MMCLRKGCYVKIKFCSIEFFRVKEIEKYDFAESSCKKVTRFEHGK